QGSLDVDTIPELGADQITSGVFKAALIPNLPASKLTGQLQVDQIPELNAEQIASGVFQADQIPELSNLNGQLLPEQIPELNAEQIASGVFQADQIPELSNLNGQLLPEQIPELNAEQIASGVFQADQIPELSNLNGQLLPEQIPDIQLGDGASLKLSLDRPNIYGEETVTLTWSSKLAEMVVLEYIDENEIQQIELSNNPDEEETYELNPYQTTAYTLTAYQESTIQEQKQFTVQVIPNQFQFLKKLYHEGVELSSALDSCVKRYGLLPLNGESIGKLIADLERIPYLETNALTSDPGTNLWTLVDQWVKKRHEAETPKMNELVNVYQIPLFGTSQDQHFVCNSIDYVTVPSTRLTNCYVPEPIPGTIRSFRVSVSFAAYENVTIDLRMVEPWDQGNIFWEQSFFGGDAPNDSWSSRTEETLPVYVQNNPSETQLEYQIRPNDWWSWQTKEITLPDDVQNNLWEGQLQLQMRSSDLSGPILGSVWIIVEDRKALVNTGMIKPDRGTWGDGDRRIRLNPY
ncbi:hypothetical protein, partial [Hydrocoleum sp. CS-953]|uniref:hypothetical protein n=1 Tax=Hydrocoleum sp. CS-953 TaxID=1671698 RepID=UPI001AEF5C94